jgi:hypothetical protein
MYQRETKNQKSIRQLTDKKIDSNLGEFQNKVSTGRIKIISAWIYPGKTKKGKEIFIPDDTLAELYKEK